MKCALFTTGKPCPNGHTGPRYVSSGLCVECRRVVSARYRNANRDKDRAYQAAQRKAHPERKRAQHFAWRKRNPDKQRQWTAAYQKSHPESVAANNARRLARKANAAGRGVTASDWRACLADSLGVCVYCARRNALEMEHVDPLSRGGEHDIENIAAACVSCNRSKMDKPLLLWLATQALLRQAA